MTTIRASSTTRPTAATGSGCPGRHTVFTYFYNKDVFVEVGLDPDNGPSNWDELDAAIQRTLKKEGDKTERLGFWYGNSSLVWWLVPFWQQGGRLLSDDELESTIDNEEMVRAFELTMRFYDLQGGLDAMNEFRGDERHQHLFLHRPLRHVDRRDEHHPLRGV